VRPPTRRVGPRLVLARGRLRIAHPLAVAAFALGTNALPDVGAYSVAAAAGADICRIPARVVEEEDKKPKRIPNIRPATWKRLQQALEFYEAEQFVEAIEVLESMVPRDGRRSRYNEAEVGQVHNMLAVSYWELDRPEKTIEHYEKVLEQVPNIADAT